MKFKAFDIKLFGEEYKMKVFSYRAAFLFEEVSNGKSVSKMESFKDNIMWVYCLLYSSNEHFQYTFDEFLDKLDESPEDIKTIQDTLAEKK